MTPRIRDVQREVAVAHGLGRADLLRRDRRASVARVRHEAMWRAWVLTRRPFTILAREFRRDRTTVAHGIQAHQERMKASP